jgi:hypothetical protein
MMHILSLGAGVQSSTLALMAARGEITPMPDCAIFADTGAEPRRIYEYLDYIEGLVPFPVHRVMNADGLLKNVEGAIAGGRFAGAPFFTESDTGKEGRLRRQCTREFKIDPILRKTRELLGVAKGERVGKAVRCTQWIGISTDEAQRMKDSMEAWKVNRYPLIELNMSRRHCLEWMQRNGYQLPTKSSCTFCPYHDDALWRDMKMNDADSWAEALRIDEMIRGGVRGTTQRLYLHRSLKPLAEVDFRNASDVGQADLFGEECEGMCGV